MAHYIHSSILLHSTKQKVFRGVCYACCFKLLNPGSHLQGLSMFTAYLYYACHLPQLSMPALCYGLGNWFQKQDKTPRFVRRIETYSNMLGQVWLGSHVSLRRHCHSTGHHAASRAAHCPGPAEAEAASLTIAALWHRDHCRHIVPWWASVGSQGDDPEKRSPNQQSMDCVVVCCTQWYSPLIQTYLRLWAKADWLLRVGYWQFTLKSHFQSELSDNMLAQSRDLPMVLSMWNPNPWSVVPVLCISPNCLPSSACI
jgi:hypothetical protein